MSIDYRSFNQIIKQSEERMFTYMSTKINKEATNRLCPICEDGRLYSKIDHVEVEHCGKAGLIECHYSICDMCGSEQATTADTRFNKSAMVAFKKKV